MNAARERRCLATKFPFWQLAVIMGSVLAIPPAAIRDVHVLKTWVGGAEVYEAGAPTGR
jgi:hypothetical protein